jgi:hypothetical protein
MNTQLVSKSLVVLITFLFLNFEVKIQDGLEAAPVIVFGHRLSMDPMPRLTPGVMQAGK